MAKVKRFFTVCALGIVVLVAVLGGAISDRLFGYRILDKLFPPRPASQDSGQARLEQRILVEESVVIDVVKRVSPSVVTIGISKTQATLPFPGFGDLGPFFGFSQPQQQNIEQDIATGFIISQDGLIVTNKHVVEDTSAQYRVITNDEKSFDVKKFYRDPANDIAILKIDPPAGGLAPVEMGDSSKIQVGQFAIAIGTALGEFRNTVTTGVISGIGRSIIAGSPLEGSVEKLDDVIQTDAAINPGNSGGPLLNSAGQVVGINVATASQGQNVGFALPINLVKASIDNFNKTGQFSRPYLGIRYQMISKDVAIMNEVPEGAYVVEVISSSPADKAGIQSGDILTHLDEQRISEDQGGLAKALSQKKVGDKAEITIWRSGKESEVTVTLQEAQG